jgi:hypothetical protein
MIMKNTLCFLLLSLYSQTVFSQESIEIAPLSVEDDGARKIKVNSGNTSALPPQPIDGQLKLEEDKEKVKEEVKEEVKKEVVTDVKPAEAAKNDIAVENPKKEVEIVVEKKSNTIHLLEDNRRRVYIQIGFGYVNSKFDQVYSALDNGMTVNSLKFVRDLNDNIQTGFGVEFYSDTSGEKLPDNIRSIQYRLSVEYHKPLLSKTTRLEALGGLSLSIGDYGLRRRYVNGLGQEVSVKISEGTLIGFIPSAGLRVHFFEANSLDLLTEFHQYLGNPQKYYGGLGGMLRLNFGF